MKIFTLLIALLLPLLSYAEEPIIVRLTTESKLMPIYLWKFAPAGSGLDSGYCTQLEQILNFDLSYNGMTEAVKRSVEMDKLANSAGFDGNDDLSAWKQKSVYYLVKAKIQDKKLSVKVTSVNNRYSHVIDTVTLTGDMTQDRRTMHRVADAVHMALFNSPGVASTRFLYTVKKSHSAVSENVVCEIWEADYDGANARMLIRENNLCINPTYLPAKAGQAASGAFYFISYKNGQSKLRLASTNDGQSRKVLQLAGNQLMPAVDLVRKQIAFISDATSNPDLFVQSLNSDGTVTGKPRQIFTAGRATQGCPSFSPDGKTIAFVSNKDGTANIYTMTVPSEGSFTKNPKTTLISKRSRENTAPAWSPDGSKIAYCALSEGVRQIWIADLTTGQERQLTQGPGNKENPTWAPDSLHLIFNSASSSSSELYLVNLNQPQAVKISAGQGEKRFPAWQPKS